MKINFNFKLKEYYWLLQVSGLIAAFCTWLAVSFFPKYFLFLGDEKKVHFFLATILTIHATLFFLQLIFKGKIFFTISRLVWVVFFIALVVFSGGINSPLLYVLMFPLLAACTDLNTRDVKIVGILSIVFLFSLLFVHSEVLTRYDIVRHLFNISLFTLLAYFVYELSREKDVILRAFDRLGELDRLKSDFITVASNRLRTPLTVVIGVLSELKEGVDETKRKELVDAGFEKAREATEVLNELIQTVEIDMYHFKVPPQKVELGSVVSGILTNLNVLVKKKEVSVNIDIPSAIIVRANLKMMTLALENVINNAIVYSPKGSIKISIKANNNFWEIVIIDNGIGISVEDLPLVFDRLYRGKEAMLVEPNKSGIGMYAAKHIIELHGGNIAIASEKGKGTTVTILLPMV